MRPRISVILPVYNGEKHLKSCIDSLLKQTLQEIEILAVDNGSSDSSGAILGEYAEMDSRIRVLTLYPNQGPSGARNVALDAATGEYIAFCDCDDMVPESAYENAYKSLSKEQADVLVGNYIEVTAGGKEFLHNVCETEKEDYNCYLKNGALWNKVFRRELIENGNLRFSLSFRYGEDTLFLAEVLNRKPEILRLTQAIYRYCHYEDNKASNSRQLTSYHIKQQLDGKAQYFSLLNPESYPNLADAPIFSARRMYLNIWRQITDPEEKKKGFYYLQNFVAAYPMKDRKLFFKCFHVAPEVFSTITFEDYMALLHKSQSEYPFKFSVIMPVYNTEAYVEDTIKSVINQSIGFEENIQIVLVNNATEDNSGEICERYHTLYPNNIVYVQLEKNAGPAGAREAGKQYATGKYFNFLDSDDKWNETAFEKAWPFLETHPEVDFVACRVRHFDAQNKWHGLDYKFQNTGIIDIIKNYDHIQLHLCSCFIRAEVAKKYRFATELHHAEDAQYLTQIVLEKCKYGKIREATFYYRSRRDNSSTLQNVETSREWYFTTPVQVYRWALEETRRRRPEAYAYAQYLVAYELQWRLFKKLPTDFSIGERKAYRELLRSLLQDIDDEIIWRLQAFTNRQKVSVLYFKYGEALKKQIHSSGGILYYNGIEFKKFNSPEIVKLEALELSGDTLKLYGNLFLPLQQDMLRFSAFDELGNEYPMDTLYKAAAPDDSNIMPDIMQEYSFSVKIPLNRDGARIFFAIVTDDGIYPIPFANGRYSPFTRSLAHSHYCSGNWHFHLEGGKIAICRRSFLFDFKNQLALWWELFKKKKRTALLCHVFIYLLSFLPKRKEIWIFSDRAAFAGDNGEYLFYFVNRAGGKKVKSYYSINSGSPDFRALRKRGNVIANNSRRFKLLYLRADKIISSHFDRANLDPLGVHEEFLKDLVHSKRVYLQHGVVKDDLTRDNAKLLKNISGFVTSGEQERQSLLSLPYGYSSEEVWLTGLARHDDIYDCEEGRGKVLVIAPTWRHYFTFEHWSHEDGLLEECPEFMETEYFQFYNALLNDERLLDTMRRNGYTGMFRPHPVMMHFSRYFQGNDVFSVDMRARSYREEIESAALFVTDYSSTAFDYAYVYRPCIYTQFDKEQFISSHTYWPGYFDYERDGFGPVCYDYESTVQTIIKTIEGGCAMEGEYRRRAEGFFAYRDGKNCERIYQKILKLGERCQSGSHD